MPKRIKPKFAVCVDNSGYLASLELHKVYRVLPDPVAERDGDLRVVDESGEDYLFSAGRFIIVDFPEQARRLLNLSFARASAGAR
jgi:hypothetical protein